MKPIGPLMREHRLIDRVASILESRLNSNQAGLADAGFLGDIVDFIRYYVDLNHHGKEEDILFKRLEAKPLSPEHRLLLDELLAEHVVGRNLVAEIDQIRHRLIAGEAVAPPVVADSLGKLVGLYRLHIDKEETRFFYPVLEYFNPQELGEMMDQTWQFDQQVIHLRYQRLVEGLEKGQ
jgi:hemerythrin-like domain-containing protein